MREERTNTSLQTILRISIRRYPIHPGGSGIEESSQTKRKEKKIKTSNLYYTTPHPKKHEIVQTTKRLKESKHQPRIIIKTL